MNVPPMLITSSSGCGLKTTTRLGKISALRVLERAAPRRAVVCPAVRLAAGPAGDRRLHVAEDFDVDVVRPAAAGDQFLQAVLVVVLVGQLQQRLA